MHCPCGQENRLFATECERCEKALLLGTDPIRLLVDVAMSLGLLAALGLILLIDGRSTSPDTADASQDGRNVSVEQVEDAPVIVAPLRIAVTEPEFDDMGKLLDTLGVGYRYSVVQLDDLLDARLLNKYDIVFVTCSCVPKEWTGRPLGEAGRGADYNAALPRTAKRLKQSIRSYVGAGGTLYVSDWHFALLAVVFPELIDRSKVASGAKQTVAAEVVDPGLRRALGQRTIELNFDKPGWRPAAFAGPTVDTLLSGRYETETGPVAGPLLVQFPWQDGSVIFTSFHNERQNSRIETELLRYLVFTTVTAETDARIKRTMVSGGFSPVDRSLLAASPKDQSVTRSYDNPGECDLQFVLGFTGGAKLRLSVVGPNGRRKQQTATSTFTVDMARAAKGQWQYTVTPVKVPHENFPFTLTVGEKP